MIRLLESSLVLTHTSSNASGKWIESLAASRGQVIAIDGKTTSVLRPQCRSNWYTLAECLGFQLSLGSRSGKVDNKSNEITAIPELLKLLEITGCIITIDAMGTQKAIAASIIDQKADYILALKGNQGNLHKAVKQWFEQADAAV